MKTRYGIPAEELRVEWAEYRSHIGVATPILKTVKEIMPVFVVVELNGYVGLRSESELSASTKLRGPTGKASSDLFYTSRLNVMKCIEETVIKDVLEHFDGDPHEWVGKYMIFDTDYHRKIYNVREFDGEYVYIDDNGVLSPWNIATSLWNGDARVYNSKEEILMAHPSDDRIINQIVGVDL